VAGCAFYGRLIVPHTANASRWVLTCTTERKENMVTFYHCSVCGMALETASVEPNYETHEIIIRLVPCSVCRPTQNAQDRAKRPLTGRNGKPTNVLADGTVLPIACNLNRSAALAQHSQGAKDV